MRLSIAEWPVEVACGAEVADRLPGYRPFLVPEAAAPPADVLCRVATGCRVKPLAAAPDLVNELEARTLRLWLLPDACCVALTSRATGRTYWLRADRRWRLVQTDWRPDAGESYGLLGDFIMLAFTYSAAYRQTAVVHASCVAHGRGGCAFIGPSGIGKSTHARLWLSHIPGSRLLNDDQPVVRCMADGEVRVYGSPWSGKTPCYHSEGVTLRTLCFMKQASRNEAVRLGGIETFRRLVESASVIALDAQTFSGISATLADVAGDVPAYELCNRPDEAAARLSFSLFAEAAARGGRRLSDTSLFL